jgi:hypothetical protein
MSRKGRRGRTHKGGAIAALKAGSEDRGTPRASGAPGDDRVFVAAADDASVEELPITEPASEPSTEPLAAAAIPAWDPEVPEAEDEGPPAPRGVDPEDSSYPPVDLDSHFFDGNGVEGHEASGAGSPWSEPAPESEERDARMRLKRTPEVARRRADLQKYVKMAVAAAAALCLAALVKVAVARNATDEEVERPAVAATTTGLPSAESPGSPPVAPPPVASPPVAPAPDDSHSLASSPAIPSASAVPGPALAPAEAAPPPSEAARVPSAGAPADSAALPTAELDPKAAAKEKNGSRAALERGKIADAIEAGERSVALDPTDSEAWLILGAAYQEKGDMKNARRSYKACIDQGKRGPKYECAAMPH